MNDRRARDDGHMSHPAPTFHIEDEVCHLIVLAREALEHTFASLMAREGLTPRQFALLGYLSSSDGMTSAELARRLNITAQSVGPQIASLEARDLAIREPDPTPARGRPINVRLTDHGREVFLRAARLARGEQLRLTGHLEPEEYERLAQQLRDIARLAATPAD